MRRTLFTVRGARGLGWLVALTAATLSMQVRAAAPGAGHSAAVGRQWWRTGVWTDRTGQTDNWEGLAVAIGMMAPTAGDGTDAGSGRNGDNDRDGNAGDDGSSDGATGGDSDHRNNVGGDGGSDGANDGDSGSDGANDGNGGSDGANDGNGGSDGANDGNGGSDGDSDDGDSDDGDSDDGDSDDGDSDDGDSDDGDSDDGDSNDGDSDDGDSDDGDSDDGDSDDGDSDDGGTLKFSWQAHLQSDLRFRIEKKAVGSFYDRRVLPVGVERNQNLLGGGFTARYGKVSGVMDVDLVLYGFRSEVQGLADLSLRERVDPYRLDLHSLYIEAKGLLFDQLDVRIGQQTVKWGVADQFNPTNNLNADDLEDPLLFGDQLGNFMVRADYWINNDWSITGVLVPVFKPALLPRSGVMQLAKLDRLPMVDQQLRYRIHSEQAASAGALIGHPTRIGTIDVELPTLALKNMQAAIRIGGTLGGQDISLSYYNGRTDFPVAKQNHTTQDKTPQCNPDDSSQCIQGTLLTNATLHYPRMHVYGFNMAGEIGALKAISEKVFSAIGYRVEVALIVPERATIKLTNDQLDLLLPQPPGEYDYNNDGVAGGPEPEVVSATPFAKWTVGLDYSFGKHVYANMQWVHGLVDEYGAGDFINEGYNVRQGGVNSDDSTTTFQCALPRDGRKCAHEILRPRLGDYLVTGIDLRFMQQKALLRVFTIFDLNGVTETYYDAGSDSRVREHHSLFSEKGFSAVIFPQFEYAFGNGFILSAGALIQLGKEYSKFGDPAAGGSSLWSRARFAF